MVAFTEKLCVRRTVIHGTKGELTCDDGETLRHFDFASREAVRDKGGGVQSWRRAEGEREMGMIPCVARYV